MTKSQPNALLDSPPFPGGHGDTISRRINHWWPSPHILYVDVEVHLSFKMAAIISTHEFVYLVMMILPHLLEKAIMLHKCSCSAFGKLARGDSDRMSL